MAAQPPDFASYIQSFLILTRPAFYEPFRGRRSAGSIAGTNCFPSAGVASLMTPEAILCSTAEILPLRELYREEMRCQITHDSIHRREGWTRAYLLTASGAVAGYALLAIGGPWTDRPTVLEYYVLPAHRTQVFELFEVFVAASGARFIEIQTNAALLSAMLHTYSSDAVSEKIVFHDRITTALPA